MLLTVLLESCLSHVWPCKSQSVLNNNGMSHPIVNNKLGVLVFLILELVHHVGNAVITPNTPNLEEPHGLDQRLGKALVYDEAGMVRIGPETALPIAVDARRVRRAVRRRAIQHRGERGSGVEEPRRDVAMGRLERRQPARELRVVRLDVGPQRRHPVRGLVCDRGRAVEC